MVVAGPTTIAVAVTIGLEFGGIAIVDIVFSVSWIGFKGRGIVSISLPRAEGEFVSWMDENQKVLSNIVSYDRTSDEMIVSVS